MNTRTTMHTQSLLSPTAIIVLLVSVVAMTIAFPNGLEGAEALSTLSPSPAVSPGAEEASMDARCGECGVVESVQRIGSHGDSAAIDEITVRFADGSTRVLTDTYLANWRPRERIIVIDGGKRSAK